MNSKTLLLVLLIAFTMPVFAQKADMSLIPYRQGDLWGYASADRNIAIKPEYSEAGLFYGGLAAIKKGGKYGYINKEGKVVIPIKFLSAKHFRYGYFSKGKNDKIVTADDLETNERMVLFAGASLRTDGYEICINSKGENMPQCPALPEMSAPELNKPDVVTIEKNYSTIQRSDLFDKVLSDYKLIPGADETYYIALRNNNYGVFNNKFEVLVPFEYTDLKNVKIGAMNYLLADKNGMKGVFFGNGSPYITVENSKLQYVETPDSKKYFIIGKDGKYGVKDMTHNYVVPTEYSDVVYDSTAGFILTGGENMKGYSFLNGLKIEPKYAEVKAIAGGKYLFVKTKEGNWGYVNESGNEFFVDEPKEKEKANAN